MFFTETLKPFETSDKPCANSYYGYSNDSTFIEAKHCFRLYFVGFKDKRKFNKNRGNMFSLRDYRENVQAKAIAPPRAPRVQLGTPSNNTIKTVFLELGLPRDPPQGNRKDPQGPPEEPPRPPRTPQFSLQREQKSRLGCS